MPSQQRLWCHDGGYLPQKLPSQSFGFGGQPTPLVIAETQTSFAQLFTKNTIFFTQVFDYLKLAVIHPSSQSDQNKPEWIESYGHLVASLSMALRTGRTAPYFQQDLIFGPYAA